MLGPLLLRRFPGFYEVCETYILPLARGSPYTYPVSLVSHPSSKSALSSFESECCLTFPGIHAPSDMRYSLKFSDVITVYTALVPMSSPTRWLLSRSFSSARLFSPSSGASILEVILCTRTNTVTYQLLGHRAPSRCKRVLPIPRIPLHGDLCCGGTGSLSVIPGSDISSRDLILWNKVGSCSCRAPYFRRRSRHCLIYEWSLDGESIGIFLCHTLPKHTYL